MPLKIYQHLMLSSALGALASAAMADTVVSNTVTTPLSTQTAGDITVTEDGVIDVETGTPVTIDNGAELTIEEEGTIEAGDSDGTSAVLVTTGQSFAILNSGDILVEEDFVPDDDDDNSIPDGPIAQASDRAGIRITAPATGSIEIDEDGSILVEGLQSYGIIAEDSFTGDITVDGNIDVIGDYSKGIWLQSVDGDITLGGRIVAVGEGAQGLHVSGDVTGTVRIDGLVGQSDHFTNDDDATMSLSRGDLRVRAPAVEINGSVDGGIIVAAPPYNLDDEDDDEDNDGVDDSDEGTGQIRSYGVSPALYIGGTGAIEIGAVEAREGTFALAIDGAVSATASYSATSSTAIEIGGAGQTTLEQGIGVTGSVAASTYDASAVAILLNSTAIVPSLYNSGSITASISSPGDGSTIAVLDHSGTLTDITNTGIVSANGSQEDVSVAFDLSNAQSGVTINQYLNDIDAETKAEEIEDQGTDYDPDNPTIYTSITGDILLGHYDDAIDASSGYIYGDIYFNGGDDQLSLSDDTVFSGTVYGGAGNLAVDLTDRSKFYGTINAGGQIATLTLSDTARYTGDFEQASQLSVLVNGGVLKAEDGKIASFGNLHVGAAGSIEVVIDGEEGTSSSFDVGTAQFDQGSTVQAEITSISNAEGSYQIVTADQLTGAPTFDPGTNDIPLLYSADLIVGTNSIVLNIQRKTAEELGFNTAQGEAYDAILQNLGEQSALERSILQAETISDLGQQFQDLLPDYSGGVFEFATYASQLASRRIHDETQDFFKTGELGGWLAPYYFQSRLTGDESDKVTISGKGIAGALEVFASRGTFGVDLSYASGTVKNGDRQELATSLLELGAYYRRSFGPFYTFARIAGGEVKVTSDRKYQGVYDGTEFTYESEADWKGLKVSGQVGATARVALSGRFALIPAVSLDYQWLKEKGYDETGDDAIALSVESRTSSRLSGLASLTSSIRLGRPVRDGVPLTLDLQGGRRFNLTEKLGRTTAFFEDGDAFSLTTPQGASQWHAEARLHGGGYDYTWNIRAAGQKGTDRWSANLLASISFAW